jgi:glycosyltransferase involved in cell wall biosynthesis
MAKSILYYTDCFIFGGCEKPLFQLLSSNKLREMYAARLIYRKSREYEEGMSKTYSQRPLADMLPVRFPDTTTMTYYLQGKKHLRFISKYLILLYKALFKVLTIPLLIYEISILFRLFRKDRSEMVHINNGGYPGALSCLAAAIAAKMAGKKRVIMNVNNIAIPRWGIIGAMIDHLVDLSVDKFVTGSLASAQALAKNRGFDRNKIINIYHGIDPPTVGRSNDIYQPSISMVARLEERKGHKYVIQAFKELLAEEPLVKKIKIYFIGDGPLQGDLIKMVQKSGLQENIIFLGYRSDYINYVARAMFLLNPSLGQEDLPFVILETMALGKPVIGTPVAGIPEEIKDGESGILVEPGDIAQLKEAMAKLITDETLRDNMGINARKRFDTLFTSDQMINGYISLYGQLN